MMLLSIESSTFINNDMTEIPMDFLSKIEFLPDGTATNDQQVWLKAWSEFATKQVSKGKIKLYEIDGFNAETGEVPTQFIKDLYYKSRTAH